MAEIEIEKKKPIWPWVILVLIILAILYFLIFADGNDDMDEMDDTEQIDGAVWDDDRDTTTWDEQTRDTTEWDRTNDTLGGGINAYISHVEDQSKMGVDHEYTNNALIRLMNAVQAKADELNYDISRDMKLIRQDAERITRDPAATNHANAIKDAGTKLTDVLQNMQEENYPDLSQDVEEVKTAVDEIDPSVPTLQQKDRINSFFNEAADVLRKMS